jgi:hypothetical protein
MATAQGTKRLVLHWAMREYQHSTRTKILDTGTQEQTIALCGQGGNETTLKLNGSSGLSRGGLALFAIPPGRLSSLDSRLLWIAVRSFSPSPKRPVLLNVDYLHTTKLQPQSGVST